MDRGLVARAAELGMPALGLTDHGVMNGAVEHYKACKEHGIKPILGLEAYFVDDRRAQGRVERNHLTLLAADDAGFRNLVKLTSAGYPRGLQSRQGERRRGAARAPLRGRDRAHRLPAVAILPASGRGTARRRQAPPRRPRPDLRRGRPLLRGPGERDPRAVEGERGNHPLRPRARPAAGRDRGRPLPAPRGLSEPRGAALRADEVDAREPEADLRHQRVLPEERRGDARLVRRPSGLGRDDARDRRALRRSRSSSASCCCRASRRRTARSRA